GEGVCAGIAEVRLGVDRDGGGRIEPFDLYPAGRLEMRAAFRRPLQARPQRGLLPIFPAVRPLIPQLPPLAYSSTTRTAPFSTVEPASTAIRLTVPSAGALSSFSIFIASTKTSPCPAETTSPTATFRRTTRPGIGAMTTLTASAAPLPLIARIDRVRSPMPSATSDRPQRVIVQALVSSRSAATGCEAAPMLGWRRLSLARCTSQTLSARSPSMMAAYQCRSTIRVWPATVA